MDVDPNDKTKFKTLEDFKAKYGTTVNYVESIDDNDTFLGHDQAAARGRPGHRLGHDRA